MIACILLFQVQDWNVYIYEIASHVSPIYIYIYFNIFGNFDELLVMIPLLHVFELACL